MTTATDNDTPNHFLHPALQVTPLGNDKRVWEGHLGGNHWIARVVHIDAQAGICALHVATGAERDQVSAVPNCQWDYRCDHFLDRFSNSAVPAAVTDKMRRALREWIAMYDTVLGAHTSDSCYPMTMPPCMVH
jgi:hypothetical protein